MIELEPHPDLIEYFDITNGFTSDLTIDMFSNVGEHYNILSNIDQNIFLLKELDSFNLLKQVNSVCDCGIGLGNTLFEIYLQSKEIEKEFLFTGVEKQKVYTDFISKNLLHLWKDSLNLINGDIMSINYSEFNIIYSYSPFNNSVKLSSMYNKIVSEIDRGSLIIENANYGLGHFNILDDIDELEKIELEQIYIFIKK